jgi:hypothetical protein
MEITEYVIVEWIYIKRDRDRWGVVDKYVSGNSGYIKGEKFFESTTYY